VLMGVIGSAKLLQALSRDHLIPGLSLFGQGTKKSDEVGNICTCLSSSNADFISTAADLRNHHNISHRSGDDVCRHQPDRFVHNHDGMLSFPYSEHRRSVEL
jgi:hypothetical protein